MVKIFQS